MMFGNQPPATGKNTTMMFGAGQTPTAPQPNPRSTMVFGTQSPTAPAAPKPPPAGRATMVFGASPAAAAPARNQTMAFGAPAAPTAPLPSSVRTTMMFAGGGVPTPVAATPAVSKNQTMVFGATPVAAPPPPAKNETLVFGTPASNAAGAAATPPPASAGRTTVMFGAHTPTEPPAEETQLDDQPGQGNRTMMFGNPDSAEAEAAVNKNSTMMFGRPPPQPPTPRVTAGDAQLAGYAADEGAPNERTVQVDVDEVSDQPAASADANDSSDAIEAPSHHDRTQRFAMTDGQKTPPDGKLSVEARRDRTQLFAMNQGETESTTPNGGSIDDGPDINATLSPGDLNVNRRRATPLDLHGTLPPDENDSEASGVSTFYDPADGSSEAADAPSFNSPVSTTLQNVSALHGSRPLEPVALDLDDQGKANAPIESITQPQQTVSPEELAAVRAARSGGAGRVVVIILALVALVLAAVLVYRLFPGLFDTTQPVGSITASVRSLLG